MRKQHVRITVGSACLGCLAPWLALAQPVITAQPSDQFLSAPGPVTFSVSVSGAPPLTYQWLFDGTAISGATGSSLYLASPQPAQWGYYSVIVSNASGSVTSQVAELKVFVAAPHRLSGIQAQPDGSMSLSLAGETTAAFARYYDLYPLEASSNLVAWAPLATLQRPNTALDTLRFVDADAAEFPQRFYRTPTNQLATPGPPPTGPYAVGTFSMLLTNVSRTNAKFMTTFWYPAPAQAGVLPAKHVEPQLAVGGGYDYTWWGGANLSNEVAAFFSHSLSNAPLATNQATFPVVLYDPGMRGHRRENTDKVEDLASWGYVVIGLDTSDTYLSVFPNGALVYGQIPNMGTTAGVGAAIESRLLDLQFVLDQLGVLNVGDPRLGGRLDLDKVGAFGWSLGGASAVQLCFRDLRCKACASMDWVFAETNVLTQPPGFPYLFFRSGRGPDLDPGASIAAWPDDRLEFYNELLTNAYWVKLASTVHGSFGEGYLIADFAFEASLYGTPMSGQFLPPARVSQIVRAYLLSFFNKHLKGEDDHLLDAPAPAYPEVMQFLSASSLSGPPKHPKAGLVEGSDGNFYGTTEYGGASGSGTVFQMTPAGVLTTLVSFNGTNGSHPSAAPAQGSDGNFYGTTAYGGTNGNKGTVFQMTPAGALTTLVSFNGTNGSRPVAGLVQGSDGNFYGTTLLGGANNHGTVFKMTSGGVLATLVSFNGANGLSPFAPLVQGSDGNFYGTTAGGNGYWLNDGYGGYGTVFRVTPAGTLTTLGSFNGAGGQNPAGGLVQGSDGYFYGTTAYGGNQSFNGGYGFGEVFKINSTGSAAILLSFGGANGSYCVSGLVRGRDGNFYGTTAGGGAGGGVAGGAGTVFRMTTAGVLTTLVSFSGATGSSPQAALVQGTDGNFYGTTTYGGLNGGGTVFRMTPAGVLTTLVTFGL